MSLKRHRGHTGRRSEAVTEGWGPFSGHPSPRLSRVPQAGVGGQAVHPSLPHLVVPGAEAALGGTTP